MNWEAIGAISDLIGAAAVVLTLLYLAKEIKQNKVVLRIIILIEPADLAHLRLDPLLREQVGFFWRLR